MDTMTLSVSMKLGQTEPLFPQTQLLALKDSPSFFLTFEAYNEYFGQGQVSNNIFWQEVKAGGARSGVLELTKSNNFVDDVDQVLSITIINVPTILTWTVYIGYRSQSKVGLAGCNLTLQSDKLVIKGFEDCQLFKLPSELGGATSLKLGYNYSTSYDVNLVETTSNQLTYSQCDLTKDALIANCKTSSKLLDLGGQTFHSITEQYSGEFSDDNDKVKD